MFFHKQAYFGLKVKISPDYHFFFLLYATVGRIFRGQLSNTT